MELRVWVDGTQRVVCGVKLTTTCQEIVFALAHATQQAGRFTMIERWQNIERLLSPNEQPLVTLQRWGDHMNEVEFILRKTSSDPPPPTQVPANPQQQAVNNLISQQQQLSPKHQQQELPRTNSDINNKPTQQQIQQPNNGAIAPNNPIIASTSSSQQLLNDQTYDNIYRHRPGNYNLNPATRRPQTILGPLTSSNSATTLGPNYLSNSNSHHALNHRLSANFRPSLSASTLPNTNSTNNVIATASPSDPASIMRSRYTSDDQVLMNNSPAMANNSYHNGYSMRNENQLYQQAKLNNNQAKPEQAPTSTNSNSANNHQIEDLYSTINKRRFNQPPAVPAKPRVMNPLGNVPITQNIYNAQMNYYHANQSPASLCSNNNIRPRHPPGYLDYMEALANRNSLPQPMLPNSNHINHQQHHPQSNMFPPQRNYNIHPNYEYKPSNPNSPATSSTHTMTTTNNKFGYPTNGQQVLNNNGHTLDLSSSSSQSFSSPINSRLIESGLVINRGSAVNIKLASNSQTSLQNSRSKIDERNDTSTHSNNSSVSQIGHDMLKVIEEQKKLLMNQKNELEKLDVDQDYWDAQQSSEQTELINRIESEIRQLEELWKENQTQIDKLEKQDFAGLLEKLKAEQIKMEDDIEVQKIKLSQCESDIAQCKQRIDFLEVELAEQDSVSSDDEEEEKVNEPEQTPDKKKSKDVAYVDKRGLISGIRSLKLDHKSRSISRQTDTSHQQPHQLQQPPSLENLAIESNSTNGELDNDADNNNVEERKSPAETNGHFNEKTANKYEFLMTL